MEAPRADTHGALLFSHKAAPQLEELQAYPLLKSFELFELDLKPETRNLKPLSAPHYHACNARKPTRQHARTQVINGDDIPFRGSCEDTPAIGIRTHVQDTAL